MAVGSSPLGFPGSTHFDLEALPILTRSGFADPAAQTLFVPVIPSPTAHCSAKSSSYSRRLSQAVPLGLSSIIEGPLPQAFFARLSPPKDPSLTSSSSLLDQQTPPPFRRPPEDYQRLRNYCSQYQDPTVLCSIITIIKLRNYLHHGHASADYKQLLERFQLVYAGFAIPELRPGSKPSHGPAV